MDNQVMENLDKTIDALSTAIQNRIASETKDCATTIEMTKALAVLVFARAQVVERVSYK